MKYNKDNILHTKRIVQNNLEFLLGTFKIQEILRFTRYTEYTILGFDEENDNKPLINKSVQRKLIPSKINAIADFLIKDPLAIFPTNLVISIPNHAIEEYNEVEDSNEVDIILRQFVFDEVDKIDAYGKGDLYLSIIDGQHRVKGIETAINNLEKNIQLLYSMARQSDNDKYLYELNLKRQKLESIRNFELSVSFFIDPVLEFQAMLFSTINRTQTKVPPDLVYSLFGLTEKDSPQKTALDISNALNGKENSPFYKRIRLAGSSNKIGKTFYQDGNPVLSQATMVKSILFMICKNTTEADKERHEDRKYFLKTPNPNLSFRKYFGQNNDEKIIRILYAFFKAVQITFLDKNESSFWDFSDKERRKPENILQTTIGYEALLMILKYALKEVKEESNDKIETYTELLSKTKEIDFKDDNDPKIYPFANRTKNKFYNDLGENIWGDSFEKKPVTES